MSIPVIDGRILDADEKFRLYCKEHGIQDPFQEERERFKKRCHDGNYKGIPCMVVDPETKEDIAWRQEWEKRRDEYLQLRDTFILWEDHFWMPWEQFKKYLKFHGTYADTSIYMPCDAADRQCDMTCAYFGAKCPREEEQLKCPIKEYEE